ncbi:hypothetical protein [Lentzea sp. NPDC051838]|uniref:hypothetical protein n=1 Tax=Lentzea sp. NPDC051838 TaxID=3154849 RepID=UPI0034323BA3
MTSIGARAGRGHLARLVVVAVLAGLAVIVGVQCTDGMNIAMPMSHSTTMAMPMADHEPSPDTGTGESLTMCLVLMVAVAAAAFVLTLPAVRTSVVAHSPGSAARSESTQARAPSLARLCLLRI